MAKNVKVYEIAKTIGISSAELVEVCQKAGYSHITHHSKAVPPEEAEQIRKAAIRLYKPKQTPVLKEKAKPAKKKARKEKPKSPVPSTTDVKPVAPPTPRGARQPVVDDETELVVPPREKRVRTRRRAPRREAGEEVTSRTIVFKQPKRHVAKKRVDKVELERPVSVRTLCEQMGVPASEIIKELMFDHGIRANINALLDDEVVQLIGMAREIEVTLKEPRSFEDDLLESVPEDSPGDLVDRPPVVALLGHVDHGKTSILDRIRNTRVAESEAGGITQDIGAWQTRSDGHTLTFIDTPGHEAFTAMRARGAKVTDLVVLVVAADDGVMPQTVEAIDHARTAEVPIVVAINKIDKADANTMQVRQQLAGQGLNPEDWGGNVGCVELSALTGQGIDELLERISLEAELLEVKANPNRPASGAALESQMEPGRGVVTNVIVQQGTLRTGDIVVCGNAFGTVRSLTDDRGEQVESAGPAQPVAVSGLNRVPEAGDTFLVVESLEVARKVAEERESRLQRQRMQPRSRVTLETLFQRLESGEAKQLNIVLKADVQGSLDPLVRSLGRLGDEEVSVRIVHKAVGKVNPSDVLLADAADAVIIAFRARADEKVREMAALRGVEIATYDVIYNVTDEIRAALEGMLEPEQHEERIGLAEVRQIFRISRLGTIAGCYVTEGAIRRNARVRVTRDGEVLHEGGIASLRQEKNDVREVEAGRECGINVEGFNEVSPGDLIECFTVVSVKRVLASRPARESEKQPGDADLQAER